MLDCYDYMIQGSLEGTRIANGLFHSLMSENLPVIGETHCGNCASVMPYFYSELNPPALLKDPNTGKNIPSLPESQEERIASLSSTSLWEAFLESSGL